MELYGVVGEYRDHVEKCQKCGADLEVVDAGVDDDSGAHDEDTRYEFAALISNAAVVPIAKSLLASAGIRYLVRNEINQELFGYGRIGAPFNLIVGPVEFWVDEKALTEAQEVLGELED